MADNIVEGIAFPVRFLVDEHFINELLKVKENAIRILLKLSHIQSNSKEYSMLHNQMFDESFRNAIKDKKIRGGGIVGAIHPIPYPDFVNDVPDFASKVIKHAINLASKRPHKVYILTSSEKAKEYLTNAHYIDGVKSDVKIVFGKEAESIIDVVSSHTAK